MTRERSADGLATEGHAGSSTTLAIDASTYAGSVAVLRGGRVVAERTVAMRGEHEERLMPAVADALAAAGAEPAAVARVVCGSGPGSFTSLRIAASIAKGVAAGAGAELLAVPSLLLVVAGARPALPAGRYVAALDAGRGEWFAAIVEHDGERTAPHSPSAHARLLSAAALADLARFEGATIVGPAPAHGARAPHARGVASLAIDPTAVDIGSWEPDYGRLAEAQVKWEAQHGRPLPRA
jgi:tRNA threonylcarbamoyladenosine biosynthesis protein TsaB